MQHIICRNEAIARRRFNVFGDSVVEPKDISTASVRDLYLFIRGTGLLNLCRMNILGLHNKPEVAVQPGQSMLTGPKKKKKKKNILVFRVVLIYTPSTISCIFCKL
jgi:hypothetical protein